MKRLYFLLILICFFSCQKERSSESGNNSTQPVDVYVAGYVSGDNNDEYPTYWKNGSPVQLNIDYGLLQTARALSIAVSGNDVYVAGYRVNFSPARISEVGMFWKNGIPEDLTNFYDLPRELTSVVVSNNDVYMVDENFRWPGQIPRYWKNGNPVNLTGGSTSSEVSSIAVSGTDVYVAGTSFNGSINNGTLIGIATYWKNGSPVNITDGSIDAGAKSIAVSGNDVYVAGYEGNIEKYWKNGSPVILGGFDLINSIAVSGTDVYLAGVQGDGILSPNGNYRYGIAKYSKNGTVVKLTDGSKDADAKSIAVAGNDIYVAGYENGVAKYWKNGSPVILGDVSKYSEAYSIFLAKR